MSTWITIAAVGLGSYLLRVSMFLVVGGRALPSWLDRSLGLVAPAAVAALVASMVLTHDGQVVLPVAPAVAVALGFAVVRRTGNVTHAFVAGLPALWLLTALGL